MAFKTLTPHSPPAQCLWPIVARPNLSRAGGDGSDLTQRRGNREHIECGPTRLSRWGCAPQWAEHMT